MNKANQLITKCDEIRFDAKMVLPRVLTGKEMTRLLQALDNRLDPKSAKGSAAKIVIKDDAFEIEVDNKTKTIFINGDVSVKRDIALAMKDAGIQ